MTSKLCVAYFLILFSVNAFSQKEVNEDEFKKGTIIVFAHQDDDLIWMLPFWPYAEKMIMAAYPCPPTLQRVVDYHGTEYSEKWSAALEHTSTDCAFHDLYLNETQPYILDTEKVRAYLDPIIESKNVARIITHNYWGEYGNQHHKQISAVVRELAEKYGKDVWVIGIKAYFPQDSNPIGYREVDLQGLPTFTTGIDRIKFEHFKEIYLSTRWQDGVYCDPDRATWTWGDNYPQGNINYIKIVDQGIPAPLDPHLSQMRSIRTEYNCYCQE